MKRREKYIVILLESGVRIAEKIMINTAKLRKEAVRNIIRGVSRIP